MTLAEFKLEEDDVLYLTQCDNSEPAKRLLKLVKMMYDKETSEIVDKGRICSSNPHKDFRCQIGKAAVCRFLLQVPEKAKAMMTEGERI